MRYWVPIKEHEEMQAYADQLLGELAAVKVERDKYRESSRKAYCEAEDLRAELATIRERAESQRQPVPVKVRFSVTEGNIRRKWDSMSGYLAGDWPQWIMGYLAAHAVIDVPAGVPSVEELADEIDWTDFKCCMSPGDPCDPKCGKVERYIAKAVRDSVLAGVAAERKATETDEKINCYGCGMTLPKSALENGYNPIVNGVRVAVCGRCWYAGVAKPSVTPTPAPNEEQVEALARVLYQAPDYDGKSWVLGSISPEQKIRFCNMARAAFAFFGARLERAERALIRAGFQDLGGQEWKPPLGKAPDYIADADTLEKLVEILDSHLYLYPCPDAEETKIGGRTNAVAAILRAAILRAANATITDILTMLNEYAVPGARCTPRPAKSPGGNHE